MGVAEGCHEQVVGGGWRKVEAVGIRGAVNVDSLTLSGPLPLEEHDGDTEAPAYTPFHHPSGRLAAWPAVHSSAQLRSAH